MKNFKKVLVGVTFSLAFLLFILSINSLNEDKYYSHFFAKSVWAETIDPDGTDKDLVGMKIKKDLEKLGYENVSVEISYNGRGEYFVKSSATRSSGFPFADKFKILDTSYKYVSSGKELIGYEK